MPIAQAMSLPAWGVWIEIVISRRVRKTGMSLPAWGVWIEIFDPDTLTYTIAASLPAWGVWIEIAFLQAGRRATQSLPAWGVWIEIIFCELYVVLALVTPRMGSVD